MNKKPVCAMSCTVLMNFHILLIVNHLYLYNI